MLIMSTQVNRAVFGVFLTLEITEILLFIGLFTTKTPILPPHTAGLVRAGGYVGVLTALVAWYASAASVSRGMTAGRIRLPVGSALVGASQGPATAPAPAARA
jgi:succinate-acetate transporter protein